MCTLSIISSNSQLIVTMNRDENRQRPETNKIKHINTVNSQHYPQDRQSGGTWFGFNQRGIALALLNRYQDESGPGARSRGELIPSLLPYKNIDTILEKLADTDYTPYAPFDLVIMAADNIHQLSWDGAQTEQLSNTAPFFLTSSSRRHTFVLPHRQQLFERFLQRQGSMLQAESVLGDFHLYQNPDDCCASVNMARDISHTKSLSQLIIEGRSLNYYYFPQSALQAIATDDTPNALYSHAQHHQLLIA